MSAGPIVAGVVFVLVVLAITAAVLLTHNSPLEPTALGPGEEYNYQLWGRGAKRGAAIGAQAALAAAPLGF